MKVTSVISTLLGVSAAANWGNSCQDEKLDSATGVLTANCNTGDGKGTLQANSVNLNTCNGWDGASLISQRDGNFGASCTSCSINRIPDPIYFTKMVPWLNCTCGEPAVDASFNT
ncbi:CVNH domain-containing protein, partial [Apiospora kogelbergensis]